MKADNRNLGVGLTLRQVRDYLNSLDEKTLNKAFTVQGLKDGYDFLSYIGPAEEQLLIGPNWFHHDVLVEIGEPIAILQDESIT